MSRLLSPIHRIAPRVTYSGGIRWSSYVGDVRCSDNLSKSYHVDSSGSPLPRSTAQHERLLVLGSGVAGCATALTAARHGVPVTVVHAGSSRDDCNSYWAQGGVIYKNYQLKRDGECDTAGKLVDTTLSLVEDIRIASGFTGELQRRFELEEGAYSGRNLLNHNVLGKKCTATNIHWNEDAAWKLACEGPQRVRELLLGKKDGGMNHDDEQSAEVKDRYSMGCVVPFDRLEKADVLSLCLGKLPFAAHIPHAFFFYV